MYKLTQELKRYNDAGLNISSVKVHVCDRNILL